MVRGSRALWIALALAACSAAPVGEEAAPDVDRVLLDELRLAADEAAARPYQTIRYNPVPEACQCPEFEVLVGQTWFRARLEPALDPAGPVPGLREQAAAEQAAGRTPVWYVVGRLDDEPYVACPNGCYGFELRVDAVRATPPPAPEEPPPGEAP